MHKANLFDSAFEYDDTDPAGYRAGVARVGKAAGGEELAVKLYEIPPGENLCPYHYEYSEEWLAVLEGAVTVRVPGGEHALVRGDLVRFAAGPDGAHKVTATGDTAARILMFSADPKVAVAVYPDSDKIGVWTPNAVDHVLVRREDGHRDYYDREA